MGREVSGFSGQAPVRPHRPVPPTVTVPAQRSDTSGRQGPRGFPGCSMLLGRPLLSLHQALPVPLGWAGAVLGQVGDRRVSLDTYV